MKTIHNTTLHVGILLACVTCASLRAATSTWDGGGANDSWLTGANWVGDALPVSVGTTEIQFASGSSRLTNYIGQAWSLNKFTFLAGTANTTIVADASSATSPSSARSYTMSGTASGVYVQSGANGDYTFKAGGTGFAGASEFQNFSDLTIDHQGTGTLTFSIDIVGPYNSTPNRALTKTGSGLVVFNNATTYTGNTTVSGGTLKLGSSRALGFGARQLTANVTGTSVVATIVGKTISSTGTVDVNGLTVNEPIVLSGSGEGGNGALVNNSATDATIGSGIAAGLVTAKGSGYNATTSVNVSGTGSGAAATVSLGLTTAAISSVSGGTGWVVGDIVNLTGGGGTAATATVSSVSSGAITGLTIRTPGFGFTSAPTALTKNTSTNGNATGTSLTGNTNNFGIVGLAMTDAGSGYSGTPTFTITGGSGAGATVAPTLSSVVLENSSSIGGTGNLTISAVVSETGGARALTKVGGGVLTLSGSNTYTGNTTVSAGTLSATGATSLTTSGTLIVAGGSAASAKLSVGSAANFTGKTVNITTANGGQYQKDLASGEAFTRYGAAKSTFTGGVDTTASFLGAGVTGAARNVLTSFSAATLAAVGNDGSRISDVFSLSGTASDTIVLQLNIATGVTANSVLAYNSLGTWVNAVLGNSSGTPTDRGDVAWNSGFGLGSYGRDTSTGNVWAVIDHNSEFAIIPEPAAWMLLALSGTALVVFRRRRTE